MNMIRTFSVPNTSEAARIIMDWQNNGDNLSERMREAILYHAKGEAQQRRILALGWALAMRGICPSNPVPESGIQNPDTKYEVRPEAVSPHSCNDCRKWTGLPHEIEATGISPHFAMTVIQPMKETWRGFQWRRWGDES